MKSVWIHKPAAKCRRRYTDARWLGGGSNCLKGKGVLLKKNALSRERNANK